MRSSKIYLVFPNSRLIVFDNTTLNKQLEIPFPGEWTLDEIGEFLTGQMKLVFHLCEKISGVVF